MRRLIEEGLEQTSAFWPDIERAHKWIRQAAHVLNNEDGADAATVQRRFNGVVGAMARHATCAGSRCAGVKRFCKVTRNYRPGLFHCYSIPDLPRTNNDLEHEFGSQRYHERRATGRKRASPAMVLRGEARLVAGVATRHHPPSGADLGRVNRERWKRLRQHLDDSRHARTLRRHFRQDPQAYLAELEQKTQQLTLPP